MFGDIVRQICGDAFATSLGLGVFVGRLWWTRDVLHQGIYRPSRNFCSWPMGGCLWPRSLESCIVRPIRRRRSTQNVVQCFWMSGFCVSFVYWAFRRRSTGSQLLFLAARSEFHCNEFQGPADGVQLVIVLRLETGSVCSPVAAVADCRVDHIGHLWPVELTFHSVVHVTLAGVCR